MKHLISVLLLICSPVFLLNSCVQKEVPPPIVTEPTNNTQNESTPATKITITEIESPLSAYYNGNPKACSIWDLTIYQNRLYVGHGNYNDNTGPSPVYSYDLSADNYLPNAGYWAQEAILDDETISRFHILFGDLYISGTDPCGADWQFGSFYKSENSTWVSFDNLPGAKHNFDLVAYNGYLFAALGIIPEDSYSPVVVSSDNGKSFSNIPFIRNNEKLDFSTFGNEMTRVYDLFILNGELYANLYLSTNTNKEFSIYRYETDSFVYYSSLSNKINLEKRTLPFQYPIGTKCTFDNKVFLTTGKLFYSEDLVSFHEISLPEFTAVWDIYQDEENLYILTSVPSGNEYKISIYTSSLTDSLNFNEILSFQYSLPCRSFILYQDTFYLGTDSTYVSIDNNNQDKIGTILKINYPKE